MRNFILGMVVTLLVLALGGLAVATWVWCPPMPMRLRLGSNVALRMSALDASMERHAPRLNNPIPPTDENLIMA